MRFYIETYGCTSNFGNSQEAESVLKELGHVPSFLEDADAVIVNTCGVTEKTERKILKRLRQLQGDRLVIAGCLSAALPSSLEGIRCRRKLGLLSRETAEEVAGSFGSPSPSIPDRRSPENLCGIVNISEGCLGSCSYCVVRRARGRLVSRDPDDVVKYVRCLLRSGVVEVQLAAQDTAAYGRDIGTSLPELLKEIVAIPGKFKVRTGMMNPKTARPILGELIEALRAPKVYRFVHMPVQSGSDRVLERMGRGYRAEDFLDILRTLRAGIPEMSFATDVIAGFPGEEEEDFAKTMRLVELAGPEKVNITRYSRRPGTQAAELYDMPDRIKKERSRRLTGLWLSIAIERNRLSLERTLEVLVTERGRGSSMKARTANYTGVLIQGAPTLGSLQRVRITGFNPFYLAGVLFPRDNLSEALYLGK
jgi:MiaB-like tRNA modifying enzyme